MIDDSFSLMRGGPVYRILRWSGAIGHGRRTTVWVAFGLVALSFGPLLVMTALDGTLLPGTARVELPLLGDYALLARFLVTIPVLVLAAPLCDALLRRMLIQFSRSSMVHPAHREPFDALIARMRGMRDSSLPEFACLVLAVLPAVLHALPVGMLHGVSDWSRANGGLTPAGQWFALVSTTVYRFVQLIWVWRFLLWAWMLWRLSRMPLDLRASHPDGAGGLAFLGAAQQRFGVLAFAGGALVAGTCANHMVYLDRPLASQQHLLLGYVVVSTLFLAAPLLCMVPRLLEAKRKGLLLYSLLGHSAAHAFDRRWLVERAPDAPALLDTGDASAICDFTGVYATIRGMAVIPLSRWNLLWLASCAALPMVPLVFFALSLDELLARLGAILL
ncbi:hypothetical protein [Luteimonas kalidii]|uniref:Uncharacterized protein n=1 Tax=Luteimonas kalidii TaxID=3042025 RepID=A0ABT6JSA9_9GAMM|nr:hypothetical protein [Luteimonas kalidii]MDH5833572.1 hypothetical protein [Luteimonas kalidii]